MRISDWSSDVCSSDLIATATSLSALHQHTRLARSLQLGKLTITLGGLSLLTLLIGRIDRHHGRLLMLEDRLAEIAGQRGARSEEHTSELQSIMRISYAVFRLKNKNNTTNYYTLCSA